MAIIQDGSSGSTAAVSVFNQLLVHAVIETASHYEANKGIGWNLNSGDVAVTGDATLLYIKNTTELPFVIESVALGIHEGITYTDQPHISIHKGPTGGDLITDATPIDMNANRNFAFNDTFGGDVYKGKDGGTVTGGTVMNKILVPKTGNTIIALGYIIPKQATIAVSLQLNGTGSANVYTALVGYFDDIGQT